MDFDIEFDASNLSCPLPILKTKKALSSMISGQVLKLISTDRGSSKDVPAFASHTGNQLLSTLEVNGIHTFYIKKK